MRVGVKRNEALDTTIDDTIITHVDVPTKLGFHEDSRTSDRRTQSNCS